MTHPARLIIALRRLSGTLRTSAMGPESIEAYRSAHRARQERRRAELAAWRAHLLALAGQAATLLRAEFGSAEVWLFGSLARGGLIDERSDIDLAARGLPESSYLCAVSRLLDLDARASVNLVRLEEAPGSLVGAIQAEGIAL